MEKPPLGGFGPSRENKNKMSRREFLKKALAAATAIGAGGAVSLLAERELEKPSDGITPETRKIAEEIERRMEREKLLGEFREDADESEYYGYASLDDYLNDHPLAKRSPEELRKARDFFEKENK